MKEEKNTSVQTAVQPPDAPWKPTYKWLAKTAGIVLATLIVVFFVANIVLKPYMRHIPLEITPWLNTAK